MNKAFKLIDKYFFKIEDIILVYIFNSDCEVLKWIQKLAISWDISAQLNTHHWHANFSLSISTIPGGGATCCGALGAMKRNKNYQFYIKII